MAKQLYVELLNIRHVLLHRKELYNLHSHCDNDDKLLRINCVNVVDVDDENNETHSLARRHFHDYKKRQKTFSIQGFFAE